MKRLKWLIMCGNLDCLYAFEQEGGEPDYVCRRCGSKVEVNERIEIIEEGEQE